jgi:hypothetical protein
MVPLPAEHPGHPRDPLHGDDDRHDPPHLRSVRREEDPGETAAVERSTVVEQTNAAK